MGVVDHVFLLHAYVMHCVCDTSTVYHYRILHYKMICRILTRLVVFFFKDIASVVARQFIELFKAKSLSYMCRGWKEILSYRAPPDQRHKYLYAIFLFFFMGGH